MSERMEEELMDDLFSEEAEGASEMFEEGDQFESYDDAMDEMEEDFGDEEALFEEGDAFEEGFEEEAGFDEFEDFGDEEADLGYDESLEDAMAYALEAEDTDEFFRRIARGIRRVAGTVGRVARVAAPIARLIPHPYAQIAARGLNLLGRLRADGASEEEALDAFAELAMYDESALPIAAGLAARTMTRGRAARLPVAARRNLVRGAVQAGRTLVQRGGPRAVRALPRIARSVGRTAVARRTPVRAVPRIMARTAGNVARNRRLLARLAQPVPTAVRRVRRAAAGAPVAGGYGPAYRRYRGYGPAAGTYGPAAGGLAPGRRRTFTFRGPVRISIRGGF